MRPRWNLSPGLIEHAAADIRRELPPNVQWAPEITTDFSSECLGALFEASEQREQGPGNEPAGSTGSRAFQPLLESYSVSGSHGARLFEASEQRERRLGNEPVGSTGSRAFQPLFACRNVAVAQAMIEPLKQLTNTVAGLTTQDLQLLIRFPVVHLDDTGPLERIASEFAVVIVVDHYRHAELVSEVAVRSGRTIELLIDVDLGYQRTGVRPGPDSVLLAQAITRLPGLKLSGVFLRTSVLRESPSLDSDLRNSITVGRHCLKFIQAAEIACEQLVLEETRGLPIDEDVTIVLNSPLPVPPGSIQEPMRSEIAEHTARVIARPSLEWCVIDAGTNDLRTIEVPNVLRPGGATVRTMDREQTTLSLADESLDLRIGDTVSLSCSR